MRAVYQMGSCGTKKTIFITRSFRTTLKFQVVNSCVISVWLLRRWACVTDWNREVLLRCTVCKSLIDAGLPVFCCAWGIICPSCIDSTTDVDILSIFAPLFVSNWRCVTKVLVLLKNPVETAVINIILANTNPTVVSRAKTSRFVSLGLVWTSRLQVEEPCYYDCIVVWEKHRATRCYISPVFGIAVPDSCSHQVLSV